MMCGTNSQFDANYILESTSGTTWTKIYTSSNALTAAVYRNGTRVFVGSNSTLCLRAV
jgi:hypothetical protein